MEIWAAVQGCLFFLLSLWGDLFQILGPNELSLAIRGVADHEGCRLLCKAPLGI